LADEPTGNLDTATSKQVLDLIRQLRSQLGLTVIMVTHDLADAIRHANIGEAVINPRVAARLVKELHGQREEAVNPFSELTNREMDVLRQIAAGQSNHEIAAALVISEKTVKSHITNILNKQHLSDRTQAAVYAWQEGIVRRDQT
jgi:NarL family two-component system response regulator LiaR